MTAGERVLERFHGELEQPGDEHRQGVGPQEQYGADQVSPPEGAQIPV